MRFRHYESYFYHTDHLGSSSWITNKYGKHVQYLKYLPFGEPQIDQRTTGWNSMYTFSGKEKDEETGYSYFGARYYWDDLSIWLSVDPLSNKYPHLNGYNYCAGNPLRFIDPSGMKIEYAGDVEKAAYQEYRKEVFSNDKKYGHIQKELVRLEKADEVFKIRMGDNVTDESGGGNFTYNKETEEFDINIGNDKGFSTMGKLSHELKHADQYMDRMLGFDLAGGGKFGKSIAYDMQDEVEAYNRQGLFGNTLTPEQVLSNDVYKNKYHLPNFSSNGKIDNFNRNNYSFEGIKNTNKNYYEMMEKPRFMYNGWKKDIGK